MNDIDTQALLVQMRALAARAQGGALERARPTEAAGQADFSSLLSDAVNKVNETQMRAGELAKAFEAGEQGVDLAEVMVAMQKASLSFQATTQVRNRLVSAYQDIMNMPL